MKEQLKTDIIKLKVGNNPVNNVLNISDFNVWISDNHILNNIRLTIPKNKITCIIGPSGSGKSTLIRSINRINDDVEKLTVTGKIEFNGLNIYDKKTDIAQLRSEIGMVFQKPCVFPKSISKNVLFGIQHQQKINKIDAFNIVENNLRAVSLWKEVSHRLNDKAVSLSVGQQQRLCIARTLALKPKLILMDEPTSSLDPVSTRSIEKMLLELKKSYSIVFVTHNIQQAKRLADKLLFICDGEIIEQGPAEKLFNNPDNNKTRAYLNDEYCDC